MSTLTYADRGLMSGEEAKAKPARKSFLTRLYHALVESQQRRAEREIARYLSAGPLTDGVEREIMRRLSGGGLR